MLRSTWSNVSEWMREAVRQINPVLNRFGPISAAALTGNAGKPVVVNTTADGLIFGALAGTVSSVSVTTANGIISTVATPTTTPAITLSLGAITPTSVASPGPVGTGSYTLTTLPPVTPAGQMIYVSNDTAGATMAFSDGVAWRRVHDRLIVA